MENLTLDSNAHTGGDGEAARHAVDFAESTLDTLVGALDTLDSLLGGGLGILFELEILGTVGNAVEIVSEFRQWLEVLDEAQGIIIEDTAPQRVGHVADMLVVGCQSEAQESRIVATV